MLAEDFDTILYNLGMAWLEHPLFHHAPVAICLKSAEMNQSIWNAPIRTRTPRNQLQIPPMFKAHWSGRL